MKRKLSRSASFIGQEAPAPVGGTPGLFLDYLAASSNLRPHQLSLLEHTSFAFEIVTMIRRISPFERRAADATAILVISLTFASPS